MLWVAAVLAVVAVFFDFVLPRLRPPKRLLARIDEVSARFAAGQDPSEAELMECGLAVLRLHRVLTFMNLTGDNRRFSALHRATFYLAANQVAAMCHPEHGAWPVRSELRGLVMPNLQTIETTQESFRHLALITPALLAGNGELAERSYRQLPPTLARVALHWMRVVRAQARGNPEGAVAETVLRRVEVTEHEAPPLSAEQHWALSASRFTWNEFGEPRLVALAPAAACRMSLAAFWEVQDSKSALNTLAWLSEEGHRGRLGAELRPEGLDHLPSSKQRFFQENVDQLRRHMICAWDAVRLIEVAREAVKAGYLDETTAWKFILPAAAALRAEYGSWRELGEDFMLGWRYWDEQHQLDPAARGEMEWCSSPVGQSGLGARHSARTGVNSGVGEGHSTRATRGSRSRWLRNTKRCSPAPLARTGAPAQLVASPCPCACRCPNRQRIGRAGPMRGQQRGRALLAGRVRARRRRFRSRGFDEQAVQTGKPGATP